MFLWCACRDVSQDLRGQVSVFTLVPVDRPRNTVGVDFRQAAWFYVPFLGSTSAVEQTGVVALASDL